MSLAMQPESSNPSQILPVKRKRGRPRKDQSLTRVGVAPRVAPPGFERVKERRPRQQPPVAADNVDGMVGQAVTGVIESSFDAGYLLTVRIGNSRTILRGVVFKPGHYAPVTSENDVAPHAQMIHRNPVNLPLYSQTATPNNNISFSSSPQPGGAMSSVFSKGKTQSLVVAQQGHLITPTGARGNVIPVVLQPLASSNGGATLTPMAAAFAVADQANNRNASAASSSKGKDVVSADPLSVFLPNVSASASSSQGPPVSSSIQQMPVLQVQTGSVPMEVNFAGKDESRVAKPTAGQPTVVLSQGGASQSSDEDNSSGGTSNTESDEELAYLHSATVQNLRNNHGTGRMTELLQALQENFDNQNQGKQQQHSSRFHDSGADSQEKKGNSEKNPQDERKNG